MQDVFLSSDFISMLVLCVIVIAKSKFFHQQKNFTRNTTVTSNLLRVSTNVPRSKIFLWSSIQKMIYPYFSFKTNVVKFAYSVKQNRL